MIPPIESIQYLVDVFIEGGYAEEEDLDHLDAIHFWLRSEEKARDAAFKRRIDSNVNRDYPVIRNMAGEVVSHLSVKRQDVSLEWNAEAHDWVNPADIPVNRDVEDGPIDPEYVAENRSKYEIVDEQGNTYFFTP